MTTRAPSWREIGVRLLHVARIIYQRSAWRRWERRRFARRRFKLAHGPIYSIDGPRPGMVIRHYHRSNMIILRQPEMLWRDCPDVLSQEYWRVRAELEEAGE